MANPCFISRTVQNPAETVETFQSPVAAEAFADARRAEGKKVRMTQSFNGKSRVNGRWVKRYIHRVFVYA